MNREALVFWNIFDYFWIKNVSNFQIVKVQPQGVTEYFYDFCSFQAGLAYKSVAYEKSMHYHFPLSRAKGTWRALAK